MAIGDDNSGILADDTFPEEDFNITYMETELLGESHNALQDPVPLQYQPHFDSFPQLVEGDLSGAVLPDDGISWAMIELGLDEPLPPQETIDELYSHSAFLHSAG
jgi:hypothetical protein